MNRVKKVVAIFENLAVFLFCTVVILFLMQLFCFTSFRIPSDSMEPALKDGDRILVNKMIKGARLFDVFAALNNEDITIHRMPGWGNFKRNDILVFNFPYRMNRWDSIRLDVMQYYVKRCIALPGDTLEIREGFYKIRGCDERLGNYNAQQSLANLKYPEQYGRFAAAVPASRVLVNTPAALGGIGATTCLFPALTLGCGAVGGSSSSNNIGPLDLINIKRVAWGVKELEELRGNRPAAGYAPCAVDESLLNELVTRIIGRLSV